MNLRNLAALTIGAAMAFPAELPVRTVVLYKHGVGYFERGGTLGPGESARLDFKAEEMNDVLKSLTINDNGGKVTGVRYDSSIPLSQKLSEFPFQIGEGQPLSAVFDQLKGARVEMDFGPQKIAGEIVSARVIPADKDHSEREQLTLLMDSGELRNVDLSAASAIRFTDAKLQLQFRDYLAALTTSRSKDKRSVYIDSSDSKARDVRAEYIMPMPAWKSSYRLLFDETGLQPTLEGWAIVDNTTGEDWTNVRMSLVSGKPISFVSQLYAPKYIQRQGAELPEDQAVTPTVYSGAVDAMKRPMVAGLPAAPPPNSATIGSLAGVMGGAYRPNAGLALAEQMTSSTIAPSGTATEIADLFQYSIKDPVTVKKNESAMLPFLQQKIAARKLIIYSDANTTNPLTAAELTNNTGRTLDGGPITVYDGGAYAGEALVETVKNGDKRFISYGVDLGTRISTTQNSRTDDVREVHVHDGMLVTRSAIIQKKVYAIKNVDARAKTLIIEYPVRNGYKLIETAPPAETARDVYRFEVKVPANGSVDFPVTGENVYDRQTAIASLTPDSLMVYVRNKTLSDTARKQLQQIADVKTQLVANDREKSQVAGDIQNTTRDEDRNRQNIASLSQVSGQQQMVQDYARKLSDQETQIAKLRDREAALETQRTSLLTQLSGLIEKLDF
ncbi:MAG TPA: DUF4139 domain-containing protein [Bryobacteraceae bacterium]|nr:DUF4139 domain-containing protein [Bryobacteraceae bacterium]